MTTSGQKDSCKSLFCRLGILTGYAHQYILASLAYVKANLGSCTAREDVRSYNTRGITALEIPSCRFSRTLSGVPVLDLKIVNKLPSEVKWLDKKKYVVVSKSKNYKVNTPFSQQELVVPSTVVLAKTGCATSSQPASVVHTLSRLPISIVPENYIFTPFPAKG